jgi:hypothetical protein
MLAFLAAASLTLGGVGWYLGWFQFSSQPGTDGHRQISVDVNTNKAAGDISKGAQTVQDLAEKHKKENGEAQNAVENKPAEAPQH